VLFFAAGFASVDGAGDAAAPEVEPPLSPPLFVLSLFASDFPPAAAAESLDVLFGPLPLSRCAFLP
jgi:hypothetical protein